MRHRTIAEGVVVLLVSACTLIQPAQGDGPKTTMYQRLCEQAVKTMQSRRTALVKGGDCLQRTIDRLFGWEWDVVAVAYPAEVLLYDQVLDTLIQDAVAGGKGFQPLAKTPESLIVHLTYGAAGGQRPAAGRHEWVTTECAIVKKKASARSQQRQVEPGKVGGFCSALQHRIF